MNLFFLGSALNLSSLYMVAGTGAAFSIKSGNLNFGGEGQIYLGGFVAGCILAYANSLPAALALPLAFIAAATASGLMALLSGVLKHTRNADFLFTSFLASSALIPIIDGLVIGPFRSKTDNLLATPFIEQKFRFASLMPPSTLNAVFFIAIALCLLFYLLINKTAYGRKLQIYGISPEFSSFAGYNNCGFIYSSAFVSGAMHGLCGAFAVVGTYFTCHQGFYSGMGWSAFSTALLAAANPLLMVPSALFLGFITTYANRYALYNNVGFDISSLIQAGILLVVSFSVFKTQGLSHRKDHRVKPDDDTRGPKGAQKC